MESSTSTPITKLVASNYSILKPMIGDLFYCKGMYDPIMWKNTKFEKLGDEECRNLNSEVVGIISHWVDISGFCHITNETNAHNL